MVAFSGRSRLQQSRLVLLKIAQDENSNNRFHHAEQDNMLKKHERDRDRQRIRSIERLSVKRTFEQRLQTKFHRGQQGGTGQA
jgi:hypothetical protein